MDSKQFQDLCKIEKDKYPEKVIERMMKTSNLKRKKNKKDGQQPRKKERKNEIKKKESK